MLPIRITLKDIASETGFSVTTISLVLNNKPSTIPESTRKEILDAAARLGYIQKKKSSNLALLVPNLQNPFFADAARHILTNAKQQGYNLIVSDSRENSENDIEDLITFMNAGVSGIIAFFSTANECEEKLRVVLRQITEVQHTPVILLDRNRPEYNCDAVCTNDFLSGYIATEHLISMGHTRIGCIAGPEYSDAGSQRLDGYRSALEEAGISYNPSLVARGNFTFESGYENLPYLLEQNISAIFAQSDFIALGIYKKARELRLSIPKDLSLVGFDNILYTSIIDPPLTTVKQDIALISKLAIDTLITRINKTADSSRSIQVVQPELVIRESVCKHRSPK